MNFPYMFKSPASYLVDGLNIRSPLGAFLYKELLDLTKSGLIDIVKRDHPEAGTYAVFTESGLEWYKSNLRQCMSPGLEVFEPDSVSPTENTKAAQVNIGTVRFRELKVGAKFQIIVGKGLHKLRYKKVSDAEEDNAVTDTETPEPCTFPEDQPVIPASKGTV